MHWICLLRFKIKLIRDVLALDVSVVVSDIDTAWVKNPIPYFHRYPEADILTSTDQLGPTVQVGAAWGRVDRRADHTRGSWASTARCSYQRGKAGSACITGPRCRR